MKNVRHLLSGFFHTRRWLERALSSSAESQGSLNSRWPYIDKYCILFHIKSMTERSRSYDLAEHIFETVWLENGILTEEDFSTRTGVPRINLGHMTGAQQVVSSGDANDISQPGSEVLTRAKNGKYYFQATEGFEYTGDPSRLGRMVITPNSPESHMLRLADSLIMQDLFRVAVKSVYPEKF